jgi:CubicO group peptidase (beta-lactamase class C family)
LSRRPRHPHERYQVRCQDGKRQRSAGIFPTRRRAAAERRAIERGRPELVAPAEVDLERARTQFGESAATKWWPAYGTPPAAGSCATLACPGAWRGRQLAPRAWVAASTRVDTRTDPSPEFQYCWWTRPGDGAGNDFWAQGNHWQFIYVVPSRDLVLVRSASTTATPTGPSCWPAWPAASEAANTINQQLAEHHIMLMGATTYRLMAEIVAAGDDPTFPRMAELPKIVFSKTLKPPLT